MLFSKSVIFPCVENYQGCAQVQKDELDYCIDGCDSPTCSKNCATEYSLAIDNCPCAKNCPCKFNRQKNIENNINSLNKITFLDDCPCQFFDCETGTNPTSPVSTSTTSITSTTTTIASCTNTTILILYNYYDFSKDQYLLYPDDGKSKIVFEMLV